MTFRLYNLRLVENRAQMINNKELLVSFVHNLLSRVAFIRELSEKRDSKEKAIQLREKAKIYLDEGLTLHNDPSKTKNTAAFQQHAVYTLHERYTDYEMYKQNTETVYALVDSQVETFDTYIKSNLRFLKYIKIFKRLTSTATLEPELRMSTGQTLLNSILAFDDSYSSFLSQKQEDDAVKFQILNYATIDEFLSSIGQPQLAKTCEQLYTELNAARLERSIYAESAFSLFSEHAEAFSWFSDDIHLASDLIQLLDWLREIRISTNSEIDMGISTQTFLDICRNYMQKFNPKLRTKFVDGKQLDTSELAQQHKYVDIQAKFLSLSGELHEIEKKLTGLNIRKLSIDTQNRAFFLVEYESEQGRLGDSVNDLFKLKHDEIEIALFKLIESSSSPPLLSSFNFALIQFLNDNFQKWLSMESVSLSVSKEQLVLMNSCDGDWFLDEMLSLIANCTHLTEFARSVYTKYDRLTLTDTSKVTSLANSLGMFDTMSTVFLGLKDLLVHYETRHLETLIKLVSNNLNDISYVLNEIEHMNVDEFFVLISEENFQPHLFSQVRAFIFRFFLKLSFF